MMKFVGYHGTIASQCGSIDTHGLDPLHVSYREDHWLGQGVYFFDNDELAKWWAQRKNKLGDDSIVVYRAEIIVPEEQVLNLDDNHQLKIFIDRLIDDFESLKKQFPAGISMDKAKYRAIYFDYYKEHYGISVIVRTFVKMEASYPGFFRCDDALKLQRNLFQIMQLGYFEKQICVSDKNCICNLQIDFDERKEVV